MQVYSFPFPQYATLQENEQLAEKIIAAYPKDKEEIQKICSGNFMVNPTAHLINEMIQRGTGMYSFSDPARAFVASHISGFIENIASINFLRNIAVCYFQQNPKFKEVMEVFERSLSSAVFQKALKEGVEASKKDMFFGEDRLRIPLAIYPQAEKLEEYFIPWESDEECFRL